MSQLDLVSKLIFGIVYFAWWSKHCVRLIDWIIVSYDSGDKQKQYKEPSHNKETNW